MAVNTPENVTPMLGISDLILWPVLTDDGSTITAGEALDLSNSIVSKAYAPEVAEGSFYSSNKKTKAVKKNNGGNITLVIDSLPPKRKSVILGSTKRTDGVVVQNTNDAPPEFIAAYRVKLTDDIDILEKVGKVMFSTPSDTVQTQNESITFQTAELVGTVVPLNYGDGNFIFSIESTDPKYADIKDTWFTTATAGIIPATNP